MLKQNKAQAKCTSAVRLREKLDKIALTKGPVPDSWIGLDGDVLRWI